LKSPVMMQGRLPPIRRIFDRSSLADSTRARAPKTSKWVLNMQKSRPAGPRPRGRSFTHVTIRGQALPQLLDPGTAGVSLSQKCPLSSS